MKFEIEITQKGTKRFDDDETIVKIEVKNGNWKYWDAYCETNEKTSMTINTVCNSVYLQLPVKDALPHYDHDLIREQNELKVIDASVRTYDSLLSFLNHRINNVKEDVKTGHYERYYAKDGGRVFTATLFENRELRADGDVIRDVNYELDGLVEVKIAVVE